LLNQVVDHFIQFDTDADFQPEPRSFIVGDEPLWKVVSEWGKFSVHFDRSLKLVIENLDPEWMCMLRPPLGAEIQSAPSTAHSEILAVEAVLAATRLAVPSVNDACSDHPFNGLIDDFTQLNDASAAEACEFFTGEREESVTVHTIRQAAQLEQIGSGEGLTSLEKCILERIKHGTPTDESQTPTILKTRNPAFRGELAFGTRLAAGLPASPKQFGP
jgi:hypothetical protein